MTSIPANVQNYLGGNRTESPRAQTVEAKEDFGKVLDRQKTEPANESGSKIGKTKKAAAGEENAQMPKEPEEVQTENGKVTDGQGQEDDISETVAPPDKPAAAAEEDRITAAVPALEQPAEELSAEELSAEELSAKEMPAEELSAEELEELMEVLQSALQQIQNLLMQQLDLTPQELEQLLQDEGLNDADLLQPETVNQLILDAAGAENPLALVMDEGLYAKQQIISQGHQEITNDLEKQIGGPQEREGRLTKTLESLQKSMDSQPVQETAAAAESQGRSGQEAEEHSDSRQQNPNGAGQIFYQSYEAQASGQTVSQTADMEAAYADTQDPREVMNQILDYMKVSMKPENTVLDMQLHPESLGTLHVQISAREGVMAAHFTASSEAVKTMLENQMTVLKESFLQQDIKVDAIEVTVETHQFESNLEQGRQRGGETEERRPKRRRLDLSSLEPGEELTENEQILTDMMAANGNSVDYLA